MLHFNPIPGLGPLDPPPHGGRVTRLCGWDVCAINVNLLPSRDYARLEDP